MIKRISVSFIFILLLLLIAVKFIYATGRLYAAPKVTASDLYKLSRLVELDFPPGNIATSSDGRIFFNYHPFAKAERFSDATLFELIDGKPIPFPSLEAQKNLQGVFGLKVDAQNRLWTIETAGLDFEHTLLRAYDIKSHSMVFEFEFPKTVGPFAQDLRITRDGHKVIIADTGLFKFTKPSLIIFDVNSKSFRVVLSNAPQTQPQNWTIRGPLGEHHLGYGLIGFFVGIDGIEISPEEKWFYFAGMTHDSVFRVPLSDLLDSNLREDQLVSKIEFVARKPLSDGMVMGDEDHLFITDIEHGGPVKLDLKTKKLESLSHEQKIVWADGVDVFKDGLVFTDSAIPQYIHQLALPPSLDKLKAGRPYSIYRLNM